MFLVRRLAADVANQIHAVRYGFSLSYHAGASVFFGGGYLYAAEDDSSRTRH
jgi:hypothetical protein